MKRRERRREFERRLADAWLRPRPRRLDPHIAGPGRGGTAQRLCGALEQLGPVAGGFGLYLASRPDLLPVTDCRELARLRVPPRPHPPGWAGQQVALALGRPVADLFEAFDEAPVAVGLFHQEHAARLPGGDEVRLRIIDAPTDREIDCDLELLPLLAPAVGDRATELPGAIADFRPTLVDELDMTRKADVLERLSREIVDPQMLAVPKVHHGLTRPTVLTISRPAGSPADRIVAEDDPGKGRRFDLARRLLLVWLQQALVAREFPVSFEILATRDGRLAVLDASIAGVPVTSQPNLWEYLRNTANHRLERAAEHLERELVPETGKATASELYLSLRQVVPFRDGGWSERGDTLAEYLVLHWPVLAECGFRPRPHLLSFYRGLFSAVEQANRLSPDTDPLREALEDLRWMAGWRHFRQLADPARMGESLEENMASLLAMPLKLDRLLELVDERDGSLQVRLAEPPATRRRKNSSALVVSLCLGLGAVTLLAPRLAAFGLWGDAAQGVAAAGFLVLGILLLREIMRGEGKGS